MLVERTFQIGGALMIIVAVLLAFAVLATGAYLWTVNLLVAPALLAGFGIFFWRVGAEARSDRLALLSMGENPGDPPRRDRR